jgi:hypothetical protein
MRLGTVIQGMERAEKREAGGGEGGTVGGIVLQGVETQFGK